MLIKESLKEDALQQALAKVLDSLERLNLLRWCHVQNESRTAASVGWYAKRKRLGVKAGIPDILIFLKHGKLLFIELKVNRLKIKHKLTEEFLTDEQKRFREWVVENGFIYNVILTSSVFDGAKQLGDILTLHGVFS
jgi:hypothetical protein